MVNCTGPNKCSTDLIYFGYVYVLTTVTTLGTIFNIINLFVFYQKSFHSKIASATLTYLTGLAVADAVASFGFILLGPSRCHPDVSSGLKFVWNLYEMFIFLPFVNTFGQASVWITLVISAERCIFIKWYAGLTGNKDGICPSQTKAIVVTIFAVSIIFNIPFWFYYDVSATFETGTTTVSNFGNSLIFEIWSWARVILGKIIPILGVIVSNVILMKVTWMNTKKYRTINLATNMFQKRQSAQERMTAMLLSISMVFAVSHAMEPFLIPSVYNEMAGPYSDLTDLYNTLLMIVNTTESVSFASNFISYCCFNRHFIKSLKDMFRYFKCKCCSKQRRRNSVVDSEENSPKFWENEHKF